METYFSRHEVPSYNECIKKTLFSWECIQRCYVNAVSITFNVKTFLITSDFIVL